MSSTQLETPGGSRSWRWIFLWIAGGIVAVLLVLVAAFNLNIADGQAALEHSLRFLERHLGALTTDGPQLLPSNRIARGNAAPARMLPGCKGCPDEQFRPNGHNHRPYIWLCLSSPGDNQDRARQSAREGRMGPPGVSPAPVPEYVLLTV